MGGNNQSKCEFVITLRGHVNGKPKIDNSQTYLESEPIVTNRATHADAYNSQKGRVRTISGTRGVKPRLEITLDEEGEEIFTFTAGKSRFSERWEFRSSEFAYDYAESVEWNENKFEQLRKRVEGIESRHGPMTPEGKARLYGLGKENITCADYTEVRTDRPTVKPPPSLNQKLNPSTRKEWARWAVQTAQIAQNVADLNAPVREPPLPATPNVNSTPEQPADASPDVRPKTTFLTGNKKSKSKSKDKNSKSKR